VLAKERTVNPDEAPGKSRMVSAQACIRRRKEKGVGRLLLGFQPSVESACRFSAMANEERLSSIANAASSRDPYLTKTLAISILSKLATKRNRTQLIDKT
jgi:hypothetical protein